MRDLAVLAFMLLFVPLAIANTFNAFLLWGWMGLIALNGYLYGQMSTVPYVQIFAIIALVRLMLKKDEELGKFETNSTSMLFILFLVHGLISASFAYSGLDRNWELYGNMLKTLMYCLLIPMIVKSRLRIYAMVLMIAMGVGFHGLLDGLKFIESGGSHLARGIAKFGDNNHYAMVMVMVLPLLFYIYQYSAKTIVRYGALSTLVVVSLSVIATNSRGGVLSMGVMAFWIALTSRQKVRGVILISAIASLMLVLAPASWYARMDTIQEANQDISFMGRVTAWKRASAIAVENPLIGGGFHAGQAASIFNEFRYKEGLLGFVKTPDVYYPAATHSIYFEVLGDLGFVGFFLFIAMLINALITSFQIKRVAKKIGASAIWASDLANYISASIVAYMIGGAALSAAYFDLPYFLMALLAAIKIHLHRSQFEKSK